MCSEHDSFTTLKNHDRLHAFVCKQMLNMTIWQHDIRKYCDHCDNLKKKKFSVRLLSVSRGHSGFSSLPQRPMTSDFEGFSIPDLIHSICFPILILQKEPVFPFLMLSAKQENYRYHFYNVFGVTRSLTGDWTRDLPHSNPALIPLGYRGGGLVTNKCNVCLYKVVHIVWRIKGDNLKYGLQNPIQEVIVSRSVIP